MIKNTVCYSSMPITVQAGLHVRKLALHSNRSYGYAFRSRAALTNTGPHVSSGGEMITQRFGLMKYIPVFHPSGVALRSKSVPDGFVTKDFTKKWNNSVYSRLSKMLCGFNLGSAAEHRFSAVPQASGLARISHQGAR